MHCHCTVSENIHTPLGSLMEIPRGRCSKAKICKGKYEAKPGSPGGGWFNVKILLCEGYRYFIQYHTAAELNPQNTIK